jgi:hypothetical protein
MKPLAVLLIATVAFASFVGCSTTKSTKRLSRISLDMTKDEVRDSMGEPTVVRGSLKNKHGETIEVWEYKLSVPPTAGKRVGDGFATVVTLGAWLAVNEGETGYYWLYFSDGVLAQWGKAGDWEKEADRIYDVRFR